MRKRTTGGKSNAIHRMLTIGAVAAGAWIAVAAIPATMPTIGGVNVAPSAWAQPKDGDHGSMERRPAAPNPNAGFLGARFEGISDERADEMKLDSQIGVIVVQLIPESPAAGENGLKVNDIIRQMDGNPVEDVESFVKVMRGTKPGQVMKFGIIREGKPADVSITLGVRPESMNKPSGEEKPAEKSPSTKPG